MDTQQAKRLIVETFEKPFDKSKFIEFISNLLKTYDKTKTFTYQGNYIPDAFEKYISSLERIGQYTYDDKEIDLLIVYLKKETSLERARTMQRNFIAWYLKGSRGGKLKDAGLVAFVSPDSEDWRFSLVKMDYKFAETPKGKVKVKEEFTPARRWSFLVGKNEKSHTAQSRFLPILEKDEWKPSLEDLEAAFNVEVVTEKFFEAYRYAINEVIIKSLDKTIDYRKRHSFAQQLLSRILFIYFLQKKGWLKWKNYEQDQGYIKNLWFKYKTYIQNNKHKKDTFYSSWLSSLFFGAFNKKSYLIDKNLPEEIRESFSIMPFLNGGLFTKNELDEIVCDVPDCVFKWLFEPDLTDMKRGFLEIFNFTIDESLPVDVEVAVDPEMLGKVYESLIAEQERGSSGIFYTPRIEIDFMNRLSLVEYLNNETSIAKTDLIEFVFNPPSAQNLDIEKAKTIKASLDKVKIVDPAVGSASFLVGMMNVLLELHIELSKRIEGREENLFALKQKIVLENLYGVDVKDWAVMVGELRLWLSLIIETDERYMDIYTKPLLPNLSFKIRQGDSLVEDIGGIQISLRGDAIRYIPSDIKNKIKLLIDRKKSFFSGQISANKRELEEIEKLEQEIFSDILKSKIGEINKKIISLEEQIKRIVGQKNLYDKEDARSKKASEELKDQIKELQKEKERFEKVLDNLRRKSKKDYFLWEVDFAEIFAENGGFDIVIGNPPYVRQEDIAPPLEDENKYSEEAWNILKKQYKNKLKQSVESIWIDTEIEGRSDLYVYFYFHGLSLLKFGGVLCFITSNSWLDVGYGTSLQEFLLKHMRPIYIIDNLIRRSFKQADVNTIIALIQRPTKLLGDDTIKFIAFKKSFEDVSNGEVFKRIEIVIEPVFDDEDFRIYPKNRMELLYEGSEPPEEENRGLYNDIEHLPYIGNKWGGKYLRAPEIYFKILEKGKRKLVRLGDIVEVRRGFTTGANEFFYLKPIGMSVKEVVEIAEKNSYALIPVKNSAGWEGEIEAEFLKPVIKSPRELKTIVVRLEDLNYLVFMCHKDKKKLSGTKALEYIKWGEKQQYQNRPTCKGRARWWDLGEISSPVLSKRFLDINFAYYVNLKKFFVGDTFFVISHQEYNELSYFLNSSCCFFFTEFIGRKNMGEGVLLMYGPEISGLMIINPACKIFNGDKKSVSKLLKREPYSIFTELGFDPNKPIREQEPNPLPDRKALDDIVFDALELTEEERKEVYWAVAELVKNRLEKAKSV